MTLDILLALTSFAFVTSVTPGPNNLMLMASGMNFGWRATVPHALGVALGFAAMAMVTGFGLGAVLLAVPGLMGVMKAAAVAYMLWLAWKIARAGAPGEGRVGRPMGFVAAAGFQWVNPKAWAMALGANASYATGGGWAVVWVGLIFAAINLPSVWLWVLAGEKLRGVLSGPWARAVNIGLALALVASMVPVVM
ncbi:LysE family translocator [Stagnihabitans tardus]|uniref:LysE family transporter n=1 Tax=Stagnihabitans tardus TaxID=2699202 RepID=A0AAE5BSF8_9RHOB|nr:LysE family translocator [Stagnihabitans tardus]NBZ87800.1 LysE family transporter [Stagnihabitans tardus]